MRITTFVLALGTIFVQSALAGTIYLNSGPGLTATTPLGTFTTVQVNAHPSWEPQGPTNPGDSTDTSAVWTSYADTGYGGAVLQANLGTTPAMILNFTWFMPTSGFLNWKGWADDTLEVLLNGTQVVAPNWSQNICANGSPGCEPSEFASIAAALNAGVNQLEVRAFQLGGGVNTNLDPFGVLLTGTAIYQDFPTATPEPGTFGTIGFVVIVISIAVEKRRRSAARAA